MRRVLERLTAKHVLILLFLAAALPTGVLIALLNPIGQVPDEPAHAARALGLLRGEILGHRQRLRDSTTGQAYVSSGLDVNGGVASASFGRTTLLGSHQVMTRADRDAEAAIPRSRALTFMAVPNTVRSFPAFYLPAALGMQLGMSLHRAPYVSVLMGRLAMLASFAAMGTAALWFAAFGESLILVTLLTPMSLFLAGSLNLDGQIIGAACLAAALLTRPPGRIVGRLVAIVALALIACAKPPYVPLLAAGLLPLRAPGLARRALAIVPGLVAVAVWSGLVARYVLVPFRMAPFHPGPLWAGDPNAWFVYVQPGAALHILLAAPSRFLTLPLHSLTVLGRGNVKEAIGLLGFLLPDRFYAFWSAGFILALLGATAVRRDAPAWSAADAVWAALIVIAAFYGIELSTYLSWSHTGDTVAHGVTGRYFLPLLPFIGFIVPRFSRWPWLPAWRAIGVWPVALLALFDIVFVPLSLIRFYDLT